MLWRKNKNINKQNHLFSDKDGISTHINESDKPKRAAGHSYRPS